MSVHTSASRIRPNFRAAALRAGRRVGLFLSAVFVVTLVVTGEAAAAPTGQPVAWALTPGNTITAIDTGNRTVLKTITLPGPGGFIVGAPDGKHLYVTGNDASTPNPDGFTGVVWVIDTQTGTIIARPWFDVFPTGLAISSDGSRVYVASNADGFGSQVKVIETAGNTAIATINNTVEGSAGIAVAPNGSRVYVPLKGGSTERGGLDIINTTTFAVSGGPSPTPSNGTNQFFWVAVSPDSSKLYASVGYEDQGGTPFSGDFIFNAATNAQVAAKSLGGTLSTPSPTASVLYGTTATGGVVVFNTQTDTLTKTIPVATTVKSLAVTPDGKQLYVSNSNTQSIAVIDTASNTVTASVAVAGATGLAITAPPPSSGQTMPSVSLTASPQRVGPFASAGLTWTSSNATACTASGEWSGAKALQGSAAVSSSMEGDHVYTLTCTGPGGSASASATVTVVNSTITLSTRELLPGATVTVSWQAYPGGGDCQLRGPPDYVFHPAPNSGSETFGPLPPGLQGFSLYCRSPVESQVDSQVLLVDPPGQFGYNRLTLPNNLYALANEGSTPTNGGIDGHGNALDLQQLLAFPQRLTLFGQTVNFGTATAPSGTWGQTVPLGSIKATGLAFVATAVGGDQLNQKFVVTYSDGSTSVLTQSLSDWGRLGSNYAGEDGRDLASNVMPEDPIGMPYRISSTGVKQTGANGWLVHKYRMALDPSKLAVSLQLPKNSHVVVLAVNVSKAVQASAEPLAAAYNVTGLATAGKAATDVRLGSGYAFNAALLPNGLSVNGQSFNFGAADVPDAVANATIPLAAKYRVGLTILATGVNGNQPNQTFVVKYQDGSTASFKQDMSDWRRPTQPAGEAVARSTATRITPTGATQAGPWNLYTYTFQTDPAKKVVGLTLPKTRNVVVFAVNSLTQ